MLPLPPAAAAAAAAVAAAAAGLAAPAAALPFAVAVAAVWWLRRLGLKSNQWGETAASLGERLHPLPAAAAAAAAVGLAAGELLSAAA